VQGHSSRAAIIRIKSTSTDIIMKTIRFSKNAVGFSSVLALTFGLSSSALAGPSPQFWAQHNVRQTESAKPAAIPAMACPSCKTTDIREFHPSAAGGKVSARNDLVGTKHECALCGGALTVVRGVTRNTMKSNCPTCAKAAPGCCGVGNQVVAIK